MAGAVARTSAIRPRAVASYLDRLARFCVMHEIGIAAAATLTDVGNPWVDDASAGIRHLAQRLKALTVLCRGADGEVRGVGGPRSAQDELGRTGFNLAQVVVAVVGSDVFEGCFGVEFAEGAPSA